MADDIMFHQLGRRRKEKHFRERINHFENMSNEEVRARYRFGTEAIQYLCGLIGDNLRPMTATSRALSVELQVLIALRFYATGSFLQVIGDTFGVEISTVSRVERKVSVALARLLPQFVKWPTVEEKSIIRKEFYRLAKFPGVIGCIDGTHVRIQGPSTDEPAYVNRKGFHSINVQAVCNHQGKFTNVVAKWPGSTHDSHVFKMSQLGQSLQNQKATLQTGIILGNSGYACRPFLMTPYMRTTSEDKENFNSAHKRTRRVTIERAFGWWKRRFHVLHGEIRLSPERACTIIGACAVLHNIAIDLREPMCEAEDGEEEEGDIGADYAGREDGRNIREYITRNFFRGPHTGAV